jgi:CRISPR-associated protein Cas1
MTDRLIDISEAPAFLSLENGLLAIQPRDQPKQTVPLSDVAAIVTSHREVVFTQSLAAALGKAGVMLICCDERHHPACMLLPIEGHFSQAERFQAQADAGLPVKKRVWRELVREKIQMQGEVLRLLHGDAAGLPAMAPRVRSGDPDNLEATAAQRYWPRLFADGGFRRGNQDDPRNAMLNYGYAVLRAIVARAVCACGLHPTLGVNHRNRYNAFCLADDLMEPLRPLVDYSVARLCRAASPEECRLDKATKHALLEAMASRYVSDGESRSLFDIITRRARALVSVFLGERRGFECEPVGIEP